MNVLFDTSVLIAAVVQAHPFHTRALPELQKALRGEVTYLTAAHCLAEMYAVLTRLPLRPRIAPAVAWQLVDENVLGRARIVSLTAREYRRALEKAAGRGIAGGTTYDALVAAAAEKAAASQLLTFNPAHLRRVWPDHADRVRVP